jgi:UDP-glucose 4-epimerase
VTRIRRVVVTGGSGRVGRYVVRELASAFDVVNADLVPGEDGAEHRRVDVMDIDAVRATLRGAQAVVHLAAIDYDWQAASEEYMRVNTLGTWHVLQAAAELGLRRAVLCSSISACGLSEMRADWTPRSLPVDEQHECRPVQAYSVSKLVMEQLGRSFAQGTAMDVLCLRPLAVVLPETFAEYVHFVDAPGRHWLFYYVTAEDVARGFRAALEAPAPHFDVFFLSASDTSRPEPTLKWYPKRMGGLPDIRNPRRYQLEPRASVFSSAKAREILGWEPTSDFLVMRAAAGL